MSFLHVGRPSAATAEVDQEGGKSGGPAGGHDDASCAAYDMAYKAMGIGQSYGANNGCGYGDDQHGGRYRSILKKRLSSLCETRTDLCHVNSLNLWN